MSREVVISNVLGLAGAAIGGVVGVLAFRWLLEQGLYGLILPGGLLGLGCLLLARHTSMTRGIVCGVAALILAFFAEWKYRPFAADDSLGYFVAHLNKLTPATWIMAIVGALVAFWSARDHAGTMFGAPRGRAPLPRTGPEAGRTGPEA